VGPSSFRNFDRGANELLDAREVLTVSWYVTSGALDRAAERIEDPSVLSARMTWTAPPLAGPAEIVVVLRDSRGGTDAARVPIQVN